jgi:cytochrome c oxidase subunit 1
MVLFAFGGIGGLINASFNVNMVVHNTAYIVGHLHLTVGTAVALTFMGICYWLVPHLAGRALFNRTLALAQVWLWFGGMLIFSPTLHELGLRGMPRRTMIGHVSYMQPQWKTLLPLVGIGGAVLFLSAALFFLNMILTATVSRRAPQPVPEFAEAVSGPDHAPAFVDRWQPWLAVAVILIVVAYGPTLVRLAVTTPLTTPGLRVW